jgi:hypothetical protein
MSQKKGPASQGLAMSSLATARVGGADTQGQLPLMNTVPKPTPEVVYHMYMKGTSA